MPQLSEASSTAPELCINIHELYDTLANTLRSLPVTSFSLFLTPTKSPLPPAALSSLIQLLLRRLLVSSARLPQSVGLVSPSSSASDDSVSQEILEKCYLPFVAAAAGAADNAKVSVLVEGLLRLLVGLGFIEAGEELRTAVETGIAAREKKAGNGTAGRGRRGVKAAGHDADNAALRMSGLRLKALVKMLERAEAH